MVQLPLARGLENSEELTELPLCSISEPSTCAIVVGTTGARSEAQNGSSTCRSEWADGYIVCPTAHNSLFPNHHRVYKYELAGTGSSLIEVVIADASSS